MSTGYIKSTPIVSAKTKSSDETLTIVDISNVTTEGYLHLSNGHYGDRFTDCTYACWLE